MGRSCNAPLLALLLCACAPALDWRQVSPAGLGITILFPCRPSSASRNIQVGGRPVTIALHACTVEGATFALSSAQTDDVHGVGPLLAELSATAARNIGVGVGAGEPLQVPGMTPHAGARRFLMTGRYPDGSIVVEHMAVFARGTRVYQVFVAGPRPNAEAVQTFFSSLRLDG